MIRTDNIFDVCQRISFSITAMTRTGRKIYVYRSAGGGIVDDVDIGTAIDCVRSGAAAKNVGAFIARQRVVPGAAFECIVSFSTGQ